MSAYALVQFNLLNWFNGESQPAEMEWYFRQSDFIRTRLHSLDPGLICQQYRISTHSNMPLPNVDKYIYDAFFHSTNNIVDIPEAPATIARHQCFVV
jgi:hypothetical protein